MASLFSYPKRRLRKLVQNGEYVEALELGHKIESDYSNDSSFLFIMGSIYFIVEEPEKALSYFEKSLDINPDDSEALTLKTNVHLALNQKDSAIICCKKILEMEPENYEAHGLLEKLENV